MDIMEYTAVQLGKKIKSGKLSVTEAVLAAYEKIEAVESQIHALITIYQKESVLKRAEEVQKGIEEGILTSPLAGSVAVIKDNLCTDGIVTTCGSKMLENFTPTYTAEAVRRLEAAGVVVIGKSNMDEFAMGSTTETSYFGPTKNPWNRAYVPGGSSGGACAAVAAGECSFSLGTDTGGSIRQPSAFCGVTGIKPTYGTVSRFGLVAYGSSLEQIGPVGKDVEDCAAVLETIAAYDEKDSTCIKRESYNFTSVLKQGVEGMKIGIPLSCFGKGLEEEVKDSVLAAAKELENAGAIVEQFDLKLVDYAVPAYYIIASAEAGSNLSRFDGVKYGYRSKIRGNLHEMYRKTRAEGFGEEVKRRILLGSFVLSSGYYDAYYGKALKTKALIKQEYDRAFSKYDLILTPVTPATAPKLGESLNNPIQMYLGDIYTVSANLTGLPAMSVPCGRDKKGLPIGVQLIGNYFQEQNMIRAAYELEQSGLYPVLHTRQA